MEKILRKVSLKLHKGTLLLIFCSLLSIGITYAQYCTPSYGDGCVWGDDISHVSITGETSSINNLDTEGCPSSGYADLREAFSFDAVIGYTYSGSISTSYSCCQWVTIWIDYNENGIFETSESIFASGEYYAGSPASFSFTIPSGTESGTKVMRIRSAYYGLGIDACTTDYYYGEAHDYTVIILPECKTPMNVTTTTTETTATISWTNTDAPLATWIEYGPSGFEPGEGTVISSSASPVTLTGLIPNTNYSFIMQNQCDEDAFSLLSDIYDFYTPCLTPSILSVSNDPICISGSVTLIAEASEHGHVRWYSDAALSELLYEGSLYMTPEISVSTIYYANVEVGNAGGCLSETQGVNAIVYPASELSIDPVVQYACYGDSVTFNATESPDYIYAWSNGQTAPQMSTAVAGIYTVQITDINGCNVLAAAEFLNYDAAHADGFDFFPSYYSDYRTIHFAPINPFAVTAYKWDFGNGNISEEMNPSTTYEDSGTYNVTLTVSNDCDSYSLNMDIYVRPNNTRVDDMELNTVFNIYPNPAGSNEVTLELQSSSHGHIQSISIYTITGQQVTDLKIVPQTKYDLDISQLTAGNYFIKVTNQTGQYGIKKLTVK